VGYFYFINEKEFLIQDRYNELSSITDDKLQHISQWLGNRYSEAELLRIANPLYNILRTKIGSKVKLPFETLKWMDSIKTNLAVDNIQLINKLNIEIYNSDTNLKHTIIYDTLLFKQAMFTGKVIFSDLFERKSTHTEIRYYIPIKDFLVNNDEASGVLILTFEPVKNLDNLVELSNYRSKTLETLVYRPAGDSLVYLNSSRFAQRGTRIKFPIKDKGLVTVKAVSGNRGFIDGLDYKNEDVLALIKRIPNSSWFLVTKINRSELYQPINAFERLVFLISVSSDLLVALILLLIWRKIILTYYKKMYQAEIDKIKSEIKYKTLIDQIKDYAIFMLDVHGNISSWNKGAEQIFGYTSDEIIGNNYSVFFRGDDLTDKLPFLHLVQTTEKGNYENEGWRYRKNGSALWANVILTKLIDNSDNIESFFNITRDLTERKLVETQLVESEFELRKLTAQIQFAREAERQNIAREVHDQLGQIFTGINLNVSYLMDSLVSNKKFSIEDVLKELSTIKSYIDHGIEKVRDISGKLRSYILDHLGLIPALQEYCREIERISNLKCRFICTLDSIKLNNDKNITLFRIIQEALTNVIRHANATEVILEISQDENKLDVKISDDGKGIQQKSNKQYSMGILGMKERALFLNGVLKVESSEGAGTLIHLLIPL
jgi:PAS domain S-box-containing protein